MVLLTSDGHNGVEWSQGPTFTTTDTSKCCLQAIRGSGTLRAVLTANRCARAATEAYRCDVALFFTVPGLYMVLLLI